MIGHPRRRRSRWFGRPVRRVFPVEPACLHVQFHVYCAMVKRDPCGVRGRRRTWEWKGKRDMDDRRFDDLSRIAATGASRRVVLRTMAGGLVAGVFGVNRVTGALAQDNCGAPTGRPEGCPCQPGTPSPQCLDAAYVRSGQRDRPGLGAMLPAGLHSRRTTVCRARVPGRMPGGDDPAG